MDRLLIDKAMEMPPIQRVALAELLLASIDHEEEEGRATLLDFESLLP
jgi:hypothetical protein